MKMTADDAFKILYDRGLISKDGCLSKEVFEIKMPYLSLFTSKEEDDEFSKNPLVFSNDDNRDTAYDMCC